MKKLPDRYLVSMSDRTEFELSEQEFKFLQQAVQGDKKLIFLQGKAINTSYIKYVTKIEGATIFEASELVPLLPERTKKTKEQFKEEYETYLENKKQFKERLLSKRISGITTPKAIKYYLKNFWNEDNVGFEDFVEQEAHDAKRDFPNKYLQEYWF